MGVEGHSRSFSKGQTGFHEFLKIMEKDGELTY